MKEEPMLLTGAERIARERQRQIKQEGWTPEHDDVHTVGQLMQAAVCYALYDWELSDDYPPPSWPWAPHCWEPSHDHVRNLEKAGALIAAEIDRLLRQEVRLP